MSGDINDAMEEAIRLSDVVVIVFSLPYLNSVNCKKECDYAVRKGGREGYGGGGGERWGLWGRE